MNECAWCGGLFVPREVLADILFSAERCGALAASAAARAPVGARDRDVRYLPCPQCHSTMNRVNFGKVSGVIVDVCKLHGTWFDGGELTLVVSFVAAGGLERTRAREREAKQSGQARDRAARTHATLAAPLHTRADADERLAMWRDFVTALLSR